MDFYKVCVLDKEGNPGIIYEFISENQQVSENTTPINLQIHEDDTVNTIKKKILYGLSENGINISYDELYLFTKVDIYESPKKIFDSIYKLGDSISSPIFNQLYRNLGLQSQIPEKSQYFYQDFLRIYSLDSPKSFDKSLGIQFSKTYDYSFPMNPYSIVPGMFYIGSSENRLLALENTLLLNNESKNKTIYICFAENILELFERNSISMDLFFYYFPGLSKKGILSSLELLNEKQKLLKETKNLIDPKSFQIYENIDLLYDIFRQHSQESPLPYKERGIQYIDICIHPEEKTQIPLDTIFKTVHATAQIPFIKYNPGIRRENIYRLYSIRLNKYGSKIPELSRSKILQLSKELRTGSGKNGQITFYYPYDKGIEIIITITSFANVFVEIILEKPNVPNILEKILIDSVNNILSIIPYPLPRFSSLIDKNIEIIKMNYRSILPIKRKFSFFREGYIESIFQVIEENITKDVVMKYRRVDNYEELSPENSLILDWFNSSIEKGKVDKDDFLRQLMDYSSINKDQALLKMDAFLRDHTIMNGKYTNSSENILENSGFLTKMIVRLDDDTVLIEMNDITSIAYIKLIEIYIDSILRLKQYPDTVKNYKDRILTAVKHISNIKSINKSNIETVILLGNKISPIEAMSFGKMNYFGSNTFLEDEQDDEKEETTQQKTTEYEDDEQRPKKGENELDTEFFDNLDDYQDAEFEFEILEDSPSSQENIPEISIEAEADRDSEEESTDSDDEGGIYFEGGSYINYFPYEKKGGNSSNDSMKDTYERELDGKSLKTGNDNIILTRLKTREPRLFLSKDSENGFFDRYSRLCPAYRQPVILTEDEKRKIDEKDTDLQSNYTEADKSKYGDFKKSYTDSISYSTDSELMHWYTCPRYWCLKTNTSLTQKEVDSGICGKIIPEGSKTIQPGYYIYEFNKGTQHTNPDGTYHDNKPGFLIKDNHPDGYCLPCCFKEWNKPQQDKQDQCINKVGPKSKGISTNKVQTILKVEAMPLDASRYGFLPMSIQRFLRINHQSVIQADNPSALKVNSETLLRVGIQQNSKKSFIGCIADLYSRKRGISPPVSIIQMCEIIGDAITIDQFIRMNNGALPSVFKKKLSDDDSVDFDEYTDTEFMKSIDISNPTQSRFFQQTVGSYRRFRAFLIDDSSFIDYTYLWDILCTANSKLFESGINIAILDITQNDYTDNVSLICPSSAYSKTYYDPKKETFIVIKVGTIFEPIYLIKMVQTKPFVTPTFLEEYTLNDSVINQSLKQVLHIIRYSSQNYCAPLQSIPQYEFKRNRLAEEIYLQLLKQTDTKLAYDVKYQVQSYQGKIIGFSVILPEQGQKEEEEKKQEALENSAIFIPCLPSTQLPDIPIKYIDNDDLWLPYEETRDLLIRIKMETDGKVLCQPVFKVIEGGVIIGILTETNQFIQIDRPIENTIEDTLKIINQNNYILVDNAISKRSMDTRRIESLKRIELESNFYSAFRTFVRLLINNPINSVIKTNIMKYINNKKGIYNRIYCLRKIEENIRKLVEGKVEFYEYEDESILYELTEITDCKSDSNDKTKYPYCFSIPGTSELGLHIPKHHLISGRENEMIYFKRISDEFLRFRRIQPYLLPELFKSNIIYNIKNVDYKLNNDEMILLQSFLTKEYFEIFIPFSQNEVTNITYEFAHEDPRISQKYSDIVEYSKQSNIENNTKDSDMDFICREKIKEVTGNIETSIWKQMFPEGTKEIFIRKDRRECSFYPIIFILRDLYKKEITIPQIRETLRNAYKNKYMQYFDKIMILLKKQGKNTEVNRILSIQNLEKQKNAFEEFILSESYYITDIDIWVLAQENYLPIILFTSTSLKNLLDGIDWIVMGKSPRYPNYFYFIRAYSSKKPDEYHDYHIINPIMKLDNLRQFKTKDGGIYLKDLIENGSEEYSKNTISLNNYFEKYSFIKKTK